MSIPIVAHWGVTVPGRPPTPSEGRAQVYSRVGPIYQQAIRSFDNGTSLQFGPLDLIDEFKEGHPFFEQVLHIDNALNNITIVRGRHDGEGGETDRPFERFRGEHLAKEQLARVKIDEFFYVQTPSKFAQITSTLSVYSHTLGQPKKGAAYPAEVDTRFGILSKPDVIQHTATQSRDARQRSHLHSNNVRDTSLRVQVIRRNNLQNRGGSMQQLTHTPDNNHHSNNFVNRGRVNRGRGNRVQGSSRGNQRTSPVIVHDRQHGFSSIGLHGSLPQNLNGNVSRLSGRFHEIGQGRSQSTRRHNLRLDGDGMFSPPASNSYPRQMAGNTSHANGYDSRGTQQGSGEIHAQVYGKSDSMNIQAAGQNSARIDGYKYLMQTQVSDQDHVQSSGRNFQMHVQGDNTVQSGPVLELISPTHFPLTSGTRSFPGYSLQRSTRGSPELRYSGNGFPPGPAPTVSRAEKETASYLVNVNERLANLQLNRPPIRPASAVNIQTSRLETRQHLGHFFSQGTTREPSPANGTGVGTRRHISRQRIIRVPSPGVGFRSSRGSDFAGYQVGDTNYSTPASPRPAWF